LPSTNKAKRRTEEVIYAHIYIAASAGPSEGVRLGACFGQECGEKGVVEWVGRTTANECEENMVIFHKNRQMRTQPEAKQRQKIKENI